MKLFETRDDERTHTQNWQIKIVQFIQARMYCPVFTLQPRYHCHKIQNKDYIMLPTLTSDISTRNWASPGVAKSTVI